jgi:chemotaxis protein MotB
MAEDHGKEGHGHGEGEHEEGHGGGGHGHGGGHGGGHEEHHEGAPEWLISFADNVALMMGFFVILLAMNMGPKGGGEGQGPDGGAQAKENWVADMILGIREAFNNPVDPNNPAESPALRKRQLERAGESVDEGVEGDNPNQQAPRPSDYNAPTAGVQFEENSAILTAASRTVLMDAASKLKDENWFIEIRGHAGPFETFHEPFKAWSLSHERAIAIARALMEHGIKADRLRIVACGDADRVVPRSAGVEADRKNQRGEVFITKDPLPPDPYAGSDAAAASEAESH